MTINCLKRFSIMCWAWLFVYSWVWNWEITCTLSYQQLIELSANVCYFFFYTLLISSPALRGVCKLCRCEWLSHMQTSLSVCVYTKQADSAKLNTNKDSLEHSLVRSYLAYCLSSGIHGQSLFTSSRAFQRTKKEFSKKKM